jgi:hypothetical protein
LCVSSKFFYPSASLTSLLQDGTSNSYGRKITNIPILNGLLTRDEHQLVYYRALSSFFSLSSPSNRSSHAESGIGTKIKTSNRPWHLSKLKQKVERAADFAVAWSRDSRLSGIPLADGE